jgi:glycosyltransferase involved in cell wall biosynthesis
MPPLVSVVIPVFNRAGLIARALDSVARQTFDDYEIIVVDDGSTDGTVDTVRNWRGKPVRLIQHSQNRGAAAARNTGVSSSSSRWIAFLDSDDHWEPEKLARQMSALNGAPAAFMACATSYYSWDGERKRTVQFNIPPGRFVVEIRFGCYIAPGSTLVAARQAFDVTGGYDEALRHHEDWDWLLRFVDHGDLLMVSEPLVHVHRGRRERAAGDPDPVPAALERIRARHLPRFKAQGGVARRQFESSLLVEAAAGMYRMNRPIAAVRYIVESMMIYPFRGAAFFRTLSRSVMRAGARA